MLINVTITANANDHEDEYDFAGISLYQLEPIIKGLITDQGETYTSLVVVISMVTEAKTKPITPEPEVDEDNLGFWREGQDNG